MTDQLSPDHIEALATSIVTAFSSRNALDEAEAPALMARVRSVLEDLMGEAEAEAAPSGPPPAAVPGLAPPRRRVRVGRTPWRSALSIGASRRTS